MVCHVVSTVMCLARRGLVVFRGMTQDPEVAGRSLITVELERVFIRVADEGTPYTCHCHSITGAAGRTPGAGQKGRVLLISLCCIDKGSMHLGQARARTEPHEAFLRVPPCHTPLWLSLPAVLCCGCAEYQLELLLQSLQYVQVRLVLHHGSASI